MAVMFSSSRPTLPSCKRQRRTATSVLAGEFDPRPTRDVLTSLLNGVPVYADVERAEQEMMEKKRKEKSERDKGKSKAKPGPKPRDRLPTVEGDLPATPDATTPIIRAPSRPPAISAPIPLSWGARPAIQLQATQRSISVTPPPMPSSPPTTPGPSISSSTSRTSSKRPHTPTDGYDSFRTRDFDSKSPQPGVPHHQRKKRVAVRKGWKGWVEGSPPPSQKLINLDSVPILHERRTRSGKNFDGIGLGQDGWV
ncbi:hypothetical protein EVG20_g11439 [Dentipellis fragilis]|uniref:Uncharacterized protein n=1 Tax=Dentipellis fragilis TaxID=205917 RepID=A0A4Y9XK81_9AGAM|nr:hypothetical protein EVG20_g11439 [Dentipellis fragilis]